jgi:sporulation protein YlmC with PRC-barrel domain
MALTSQKTIFMMACNWDSVSKIILFTRPINIMTNLARTQISSSTAGSCTVKTARDEKVGSIKDIMINIQTGEVSYIVLKVNEGFLNLGSKLIALPWKSFQFNSEQDNVAMVKESKETLENSPGFDESNWPKGPQDEFILSIHSYYGQKNRSLSGGSMEENDHLTEDRTVGITAQDHQMQDHALGSSFLGKKREDEKLGSKRGGNPII